MIAAVGGLALAGAPEALADPIPLAPADGAEFTARVGQITFQATVDRSCPPRFRARWTSASPGSTSPADSSRARSTTSPPVPIAALPPLYQAGPDSDANWPNRPGTYYWQARYDNCALADPNCFSPIQSLTIEPLAPPTHRFPADDATIPYGGEAIFSVQDVPSYTRDGTRIDIEFSKSTDLSPDGTFADPERVVRPASVGGGVYRYHSATSINERPGTYYWIVERFDCSAEPRLLCDGRRDPLLHRGPSGRQAPAPNTTLTRHPGRRTRKRRARFAFVSSLPGSSFQCHYTGGWSRCLIAAEVPAPQARPLPVQGSGGRQRQDGMRPLPRGCSGSSAGTDAGSERR